MADLTARRIIMTLHAFLSENWGIHPASLSIQTELGEDILTEAGESLATEAQDILVPVLTARRQQGKITAHGE